MFGLVAKDKQGSNSATTSTLTSGTVTTPVANVELINYGLPGGSRVISKIIYAPSDFKSFTVPAVPGIASLLYFNVAPGLPKSVSENDPNRFVLPDNASVIGALLTNNGTIVITTIGDINFAIYPVAYTTTLPASGQLSNIVSDITLGNLNSPGGFSVGFNNPGYSNLAALGSAGATVPTLAVIIPPTKPLSIGLELGTLVPGTQPSITSGDMALILTYILE
jgi:hypothetical protein